MINSKDFIEYMNRHRGKANAVFSKEIEQRFHVSGTDVRETVNKLRIDGIPICSGVQGYWMAENEDDVIFAVKSLISRRQGIDNAIKGLESILGWEKK